MLRQQVDTLQLVAKTSYAKRVKDAEKKLKDWQKEQDKKKKKGMPYDSCHATGGPETQYLTLR